MKKLYLFITLCLVLSISFVAAAPPWKKTSGSSTGATTPAATAPTTTQTKVIIINNTQAPAAQTTEWYKDWNFIAIAIAVTGALIGWLISRRVRGKTATYMSEIDKVYRTYNKNSNKCEAELTHLREKIEDDFKKGKINDQSLSILDSRIDKYSKELRSEIVSKRFALPEDINKNIKHMLADGIITREEYDHFKEVLAKTSMSAKDKEEINKLMKKWKDEDRR